MGRSLLEHQLNRSSRIGEGRTAIGEQGRKEEQSPETGVQREASYAPVGEVSAVSFQSLVEEIALAVVTVERALNPAVSVLFQAEVAFA